MFSSSYERDPSKLQTNSKYQLYAGALYDRTWLSAAMAVYRIAFLLSGIAQYIVRVTLRTKEDSQVTIIEALHWIIVFTSVVTMVISCLCRSSLFLQMRATVKSGFFDYGGSLSEEQINVRAEANRNIHVSTTMFSISCFFALISSYMKAPLFMDRFALPYPLWMPFEIKDWFSYLVAMLWTFNISSSMVLCACSNWVANVTMAGHLIAQFRILILAVEGIDALAVEEGAPHEREKRMLARIKECVQHQLRLIKFFNDLQTYFDHSLLVAAFSTGLILCTLGYLIISPETPMATIGTLLLVLIPELLVAGFYCILGQKIADVTDEVGIAIYNLKWYTMPLAVQRDLLIMMIGSKKTRQLTGMGLHEFSIKGLSEILQGSFTYFNMLIALSGGK